MALYPQAKQVPATHAGTRFTAPVTRVGHHKTVTNSENAKALYGGTGSWPHFTVGPSGVQQHYDTSIGSRSFKNAKGGVETNSLGVIQIEIVGMPGETMPQTTAWHLVALLHWIQQTHGVPWVWPMGRPPQDARTGAGVNNGHRNAQVWAHQAGHYAHAQVPENDHWDPAYTDDEWWWLNSAMKAA